jgi:hypothetical protein
LRALVGESALAAERREVEGPFVSRRGFSENKKLYEAEDENCDRELPEQETLRKGKASDTIVQ